MIGAYSRKLASRLPLLVAVALSIYALALVGYSYATWQRLKDETNRYLLADSSRRAGSISDLLNQMRDEAERHAELAEIRNYLVNRDLGMSPRYGLNASLNAIAVAFDRHAQHRWNTAQPSRILFIDTEGEIRADSLPDAPRPEINRELQTTVAVEIDGHAAQIRFVFPINHKGHFAGHVVTISSASELYRTLIVGERETEHREQIVTESGAPLASEIPRWSLPPALASSAAEGALRQIHSAAGDHGTSATTDTLMIKTEIGGYPLHLITLVPTRLAYGHIAPASGLVLAAVVPLLLLGGAFWVDRLQRVSISLGEQAMRAETQREAAEVRNMELAAEIARREAIESVLQDRTSQLDEILSQSPDGFVTFDREYRVSKVNQAFLALTNADESALLGLQEHYFNIWLASSCIASARFPGVETLRSTKVSVGGTAVAAKQGRRLIEMEGPGKRVLEVELRESNAKSISQILYVRDVTHESEVNRMKSEFLSTAAHELRTPMSSVLGYSEVLLAQDFHAEERQQFIATVHRNAELMATIIDELLDLARIEARRGKDFRIESLSAEAVFRQIVGDFRAPPGRDAPIFHGLDCPCWIRADRGKLTQAVTNVLSNAYKYSPQGGDVEVRMLLLNDDAESPDIGLRITDHGMGMTPDIQARIFERFYRADTSGKIPGTGLGLSIVKEIVDLHGGGVFVDSVPFLGTSVTLSFPVKTPLAVEQTLPTTSMQHA